MSSKKSFTPGDEKNKIEPGTLYLVATPIGNMSDISERAVKVLSEVDIVAAEDTRNSAKLLSFLDIRKPLTSYFEHNKRERGEEITKMLEDGKSVALITDAGTPAISDPGEDLVALCANKGIKATSVPGCCAAINALALSALSTGKFVFEGFIPVNKADRRERISFLSKETRTLIVYEAPHKLRSTLADLAASFGEDRKISLCREMTKLNEEVMRTTLGRAVKEYETREPKGEYVLIIEGADPKKYSEEDTRTPKERVSAYIDSGMDKREAVKLVAKEMGVPKNIVYSETLDL